MGLCLDPTPAMGDLSTEIRSRSVKIYNSSDDHTKHIICAEGGVVEFDIADIPKVRAALDQIERYCARRRP